MPVTRTACSRDCPDTCSILVHTDEQGKAVKLQGDPDDPVTQGFLCERTSRFLNRQYDPHRLMQPLMRRQRGGALEPVSWDEALDRAAAELTRIKAESGGAAIMHYRSGGSLGLLKSLSERLFEAFGPVTLKRGDICSGAGEAAQELDFGVSESHDLFDLENSRLIVLWGKNVHTSGPHLLPILVEARRRGARVIGIDPVRTRQTAMVDLFLQPRAGSDAALALAVAGWLLRAGKADPRAAEYCDHYEEFCALALSKTLAEWAADCDLPEAEVEALAREFESRPAAIMVGWGMARRRNGAQIVRAVDALSAISGNLGVAGGGVAYYCGRRTAFDVPDPRSARTLPEACLGPALLAAQDPPVRAVWVTAGNPLSMLPDSGVVREAFAKLDFVVVVDTHPTDTTDAADLVLPTLTLLEDDDVLGAYGNHYLRVSQPAVAPPGEARHELWIWQQMAARLGLGDLLDGTPREWKKRLMGRLEEAGVPLEELEQGPVRNPLAKKVLFEDRRFPTPSGKMQLLDEPVRLPAADPDFPLTLMALSTPKAQASQWSVPHPGLPEARVHPSLGHGDREEMFVESRVGRMRVRLKLDASVRPELVVMAKGGMMRDGQCSNLLVRAEETDRGGGAVYYDQAVRLVNV